MGHRKRRTKSFSDHPDPSQGASRMTPTVGEPPDRRIEREVGHRHRWLRRLFWACVILAAVIVILRIALWLSLPWIIDKTMEQYGLNARYERLNLSLLTGDAELWHLVLVPTDANTPFADVEYCRGAVSLVTLLSRRLVVRRVEIDGMDISLTRAQDGTFPQLRTLLTVLRQRSEAAQPTDSEAAPTSVSPHQIDLTPPLRMDALRLQHVQLQFRDETVEPVFQTQLDLNVRLSDLRSDKRKTRFQVLLSSPPVLDQLQIDGTGSAEGRDLLAELHVALQGLHPDAVKDYLADLGLVPDARNLALSCSGSVRVQGIQVTEANDVAPLIEQTASPNEVAAALSSATLRVQLESKNTTVTIDGTEHFVLEHAVVDANVADSGAIQAGQIRIRGGAFHAWRRPTGLLSMGGFEFTRRSSHVPPLADGPSDQSAKGGTGDGFAWSLDGVEVRDVRLVLHDQSVSPQTNLVLDLNDVTVRSARSGQDGLALTARLGAPGIVETLQADGTMVLSSSRSNAALKISGTGIRPDLLKPYFGRLGLESLYTGGTFSCDVNATFTNQPNEPIEASGAIRNIHLQDTEELFGLKAIDVQGVKIDPAAGATRIDQVEISGQRLAVARDREGCLATLGFRLVGRNDSGLQIPDDGFGTQRGGDKSAIRNPQSSIASTPDAHRERTTRIEIGRLSWHDNRLTFVDRMVTPAKTIAVPDLGFELTNLVLGGDPNAASPASVKAWLRSPGTIETVELSGSVAPEAAGLSFDLDLRGDGLALVAMAPYLAALGAESSMAEGSVAARTKGRITWGSDGLLCSATIRDAAVNDGAAEMAGLDQIDIAQLQLATAGLAVERITLERPRLMLSRDESGVLACAGLRIVPGQKTKTETPPKPVSPMRVGRLEVKNAEIQWSDDAVTPAVSQTMGIDLVLSDLALGVESPPATISATVRAPGMVQQATVAGQLQTTPSKQGADLTLDASGVNAGPLLSYLPPAVRPTLEEGRLHARITGELTAHPEGGRRIRVSAADVDYRGDSEPEPFLRFDSAELAVDRFDPNAHLISIEQISLQGLEATVERKASGLMSLLGFDFGSVGRASAHAVDTVTEQPAAQQAVPDQAQRLASGVARKARRNPLVVLERLSLEASKLTVKDAARPAAKPLVISNLQVANSETVKLLGDEPDTNPPVKIDVHGQIEPLTESLSLKVEVSPFIAQPQILAEWDITQIQGPGLVSILPEVRSAVDANSLHTGRFSGTAQLTLRMERRHVAEFDFSRPFGLDASFKSATFRDAQTDTVLAGVEEMRIVAPRVDLKGGSVHVKEIGLVNPQGAIRRETDGWHLLGLTWRTTAKERSTDANAIAPANPQSPIPNPQSAFDLRVDQFLVTGVDFALVDNTVAPPMYVPLKGLDVEVRGFATAGAGVKTPMRFNVIATAGEVPLPQTRRSSTVDSAEPAEGTIQDSSEPSTMENRLLFQELSATGRLTLYPRPDGWVKAGLSGLELVNFKGVAGQNGMTLRKGVFDASVDMRFHKDQPLSTRARLVFTDLSLTEPPDGFLAQLLTLPASLDTVLFILRDAGGSIRLPLSFKIDEDGLSRGQVTQAAVGAAATLIAGAVAGSPYRVAGTIGNILGGEKEETSGAETHVVEYAAGVTALSDRQAAELAQIAERLRNERDLAVTVRHHLGGADIEKAAGLVNLSDPQTKALLAKLRQERTELQRRRDELAGQTRAAYTAGYRGNVTDRTRQLQQVETQLGLIERALDNLLETMRPGSEYAARRRVQDACIAIGKARIETVAALLAIEPVAGGPEAAGRITFVPPRFTEASEPGGRITLTLSKSKAR